MQQGSGRAENQRAQLIDLGVNHVLKSQVEVDSCVGNFRSSFSSMAGEESILITRRPVAYATGSAVLGNDVLVVSAPRRFH